MTAPHAIPRILPLDVGMPCSFADQNTPVPLRMATIRVARHRTLIGGAPARPTSRRPQFVAGASAACYHRYRPTARRFPPPWIEKHAECFIES
jgi:hypothetical protein